MKIEGPLVSGKFVDRPNRFIAMVAVDGQIVRSHLPDPGRLKELLIPGADLLVRPAPKGSERKTKYSTVMVRHEGQLISLVSALPNRFVLESLQEGILPMFKAFRFVRAEIAQGNHRFDFLLEDENENPFYLEVKSVTFVENGCAKFPDAVTARGARHAKALSDLVMNGKGAGILFVCQRPDADRFEPMWDRDPKFSQALYDAQKAGVLVWCIATNISETEMTYKTEIPVNLEPPE
ncbi:MAG: DNA/RNA nuclease SfsA [Candidatus Marinimicrobia bacterium]|nr:DNA/RNA nuclease SfsA [Candidatus Neomarinimicrobiota bacterium]MBT3946784.1 DNA/RNA nuclease SfsA [Candidatus Neomarinimicrobiota bacterium]MBT4064406.1 DNA/RNA nuclease SfsA [Candidatus Neomarinimicrobiota bacterium]MBT4307375.1 DNA/RNA nuclease SfsA [Candidatus Neomarinimicrobiota bacterium]MBT4454112.1 DNA/RNA nuclease SfsA [Candidatus Neomarinimicrobiota bacterium]